jgi:hypothetical protein
MGALIDIAERASAAADDEDRQRLAVARNLEALGGLVGDISQPAEQGHVVPWPSSRI